MFSENGKFNRMSENSGINRNRLMVQLESHLYNQPELRFMINRNIFRPTIKYGSEILKHELKVADM